MEDLFGGDLEGEAEKFGEDQLRQRSPEAADELGKVAGGGKEGEETGHGEEETDRERDSGGDET